MTKIKYLTAFAVSIFQRYPRLLAVISFMSGVASFFLINRQHKTGGVIAVVLIICWIWLMLENIVVDKINQHFAIKVPSTLLRYGTQLIHQESLFFVLPFFLITTTWDSGQAIFTGLLVVAALFSVIDPFYYRWLAARRLLFMAFHTLTLFIMLLTVLPIVLHLTTDQSYRYATVATVVLAIPTLFRLAAQSGRWASILRTGVLIASLAAVLWYGRLFVPPATLWLTQVHITSEKSEKNESSEGIKTLTDRALHSQGLYAFTAIRAPRGLNETVFHVWKHEGKEVDRIALSITGGRKDGYRTWTHKNNFPADSVGKWQIQVLTDAGQMIGVLRFTVTPEGKE
ncbi:DUF5924 family protein [Flocculibacter collagenilyticus]|uniref:DUF5924 family protein n=1 Tax=Flocculibacter collagenilyticus TaxID=2744479 RepID=UPI0018F3E898|nr:DUF5924 family protein [Flocculibacter collagenilyticus]